MPGPDVLVSALQAARRSVGWLMTVAYWPDTSRLSAVRRCRAVVQVGCHRQRRASMGDRYGTTPYTETEVLLALLDGDRDRAEELLREMTGAERSSFAATVDDLAGLIDRTADHA